MIINKNFPWFANESLADQADDLGSLVANEYSATADPKDNWVQLSPFGTFPNKAGKQVFNAADSTAICNEFASLSSKVANPFGLPFYVGHPDHPAFKDFYKDGGAKGRVKELQSRHDPRCRSCAEFANESSDEPCRDHGLFGRVKWNDDGKRLIANESYHGHSVNWQMHRETDGWHPHFLKSVGFTNEPGIPVPAITAANEKRMSDANKKTLMHHVNGLLGTNFANEDDAMGALDSMANEHKANKTALANLQGAHDTLTKTHGDMCNTMAEVTKKFGANEAVATAIAPLFATGAEVPDALVPFLANEVATTRTAASKAGTLSTESAAALKTAGVVLPEAGLLPFLANEVTTARRNFADERAARKSAVETLLLAGGFLSKAEVEALAPEFANEATFNATMLRVTKLAPKYRTVSGVAVAEKNAQLQQVANEKASNVNEVVNFVNERVKDNERDGKKPTGGMSPYDFAWGQIEREKPELFAKMKKPE